MRSPAPYREIDDIGLLPITTDTAEVLYRVVDAAYEKRSNRSLVNLHPPGSTSSCPRPSPTPPSTGSCTTPTTSSPVCDPGGHRWAEILTAHGQILLALDTDRTCLSTLFPSG
jgi:hypothetical protein